MCIQFGMALYNVQVETKLASEHTQELGQLEMCALMHDIQYIVICLTLNIKYLTL